VSTTTIKFTSENDDGEEIEHELPAKFEVCPGCEGHGTRLCEGMRGHAYTVEEFNETFDEEEREAYFTRGSHYDVTCEECHGKRVVAVPDESACRSDEAKETLRIYEAKLRDDYEYAREVAAERRAGC
jgi:RecJ-like exonuclease